MTEVIDRVSVSSNGDSSRIAKILSILGPHYISLKQVDEEVSAEGTTREVYISEWTPNPKNPDVSKTQRRGIKVDKQVKDISNERSASNLVKGYNTAHDVLTQLSLPDPEAHGLVRLLDAKNADELGEGAMISVENWLDGATSLQRKVKNSLKKRLEDKEFIGVFTDVIEGERYLVENGIYHRDPTPRNILVTSEGKGRLTDLALAKRIGDNSRCEVVTTYLNKSISDPRSSSGIHDEQSEIHFLGADMYYALTGEIPDINDLKKAIKKVPRKWRKIIRNCLRPDLDERYRTVKDLSRDFNDKAKADRSYWNYWHPMVGMTVIGGILAVGAGIMANNKEKSLESRASETSVVVTSDWDSKNIAIGNNLLELGANVMFVGESSANEKPYVSEYHDAGDFILIPEEEYRSRSPRGLFATINAREIPRKKRDSINSSSIGTLKGRIYFEGFEGKDFSIYPSGYNRSSEYGAQTSMIGFCWPTIELPPREEFGNVRNIAIEVYAPDNHDVREEDRRKDIVYDNPNTVIARLLVPVVVGKIPDKDNASEQLKLRRATIGWFGAEKLNFRRVDDEMGRVSHDLRSIVVFPEDDSRVIPEYNSFRSAVNVHDVGNFDIPAANKITNRTLAVGLYNSNGDLINYTGIPIRSKDIIYRENPDHKNDPPNYKWEINNHPDENYEKGLRLGWRKIPKRIEPLKDKAEEK